MRPKKDDGGKRSSLRQRIKGGLFSAVLGGLIACLICVLVLNAVYSREFARQQEAIADGLFSSIELCMEESLKYSRQIISNLQIQKTLLAIADKDRTEITEDRQELASALALSVGDKPKFADNVLVLDTKGYFYSHSGGYNAAAHLNTVRSDLLQIPEDGRACWQGTVIDGVPYLMLLRCIREAQHLSLRVIGYEAVLINLATLIDRIKPANQTQQSAFLIRMDGSLLYASDARLLPLDSPEPAGARRTARCSGTTWFVSGKDFFDNRLQVICCADYGRISAVFRLSAVLLLGILCMGGLAALLTARQVDSIFRNMDSLRDVALKVQGGDLNIRPEARLLQSNDEIGLLANTFQTMLEEIDDLVNQRLRRQLSATQAKCRMLQAQIHPHFLYNTLETIHAIAVRDGNEEISRMCVSLSHLVRASYRGGMYVPLSEEISFVQEYLTIYRIRFGSRLHAEIEYDPEDEDVLLPQMTLQPLVENSVRYGLMQKLDRGIIRLRIRRRRGFLVISLFDNGVGLPREVVERYQAINPEDELNVHGYGNVICRLRFTYGEAARVEAHARAGRWTNLGLVIPDRVPERMLRQPAQTEEGRGAHVPRASDR